MAQRTVRPEAVQSARQLLLAGLILQVVQVGFFFGVAYYLSRTQFFGSILFYLGAIGIVWLALVYVLAYRPARSGDIDAAKTATLVFGVLSIFTVSVIPGLLYVFAYHEMGNAQAANSIPRPLVAPRPLAGGVRACVVCGRANPEGTTFCQGCGFGLH